jgi:hypothetical protein
MSGVGRELKWREIRAKKTKSPGPEEGSGLFYWGVARKPHLPIGRLAPCGWVVQCVTLP